MTLVPGLAEPGTPAAPGFQTGAGDVAPTVGPLDPSSLSSDQLAAYNGSFQRDEASGGIVDSYDDLLFQNDVTDVLTDDGQFVVGIKHIVDPATGEDHWIVSVPSETEWADLDPTADTLVADPSDTTSACSAPVERADGHMFDWSAMGDSSAATDSGLAPSAQEQQHHQAAVFQAMHDAGVPDGADVLFTGTGQGGYLAAGLAASTDLPYHCVGVVTAGTPIGEISVPPDIPVVSFEHPGDPYTQVDLNGDGVVNQPTGSNYTQVILPDAGTGTFSQHGYAEAVAAYLQTDLAVAQSHPEWFGRISSHEMYTWTDSTGTSAPTTTLPVSAVGQLDRQTTVTA